MTSYQVMQNQAGSRLIISCKYEKCPCVCSSHYESLEEFFQFKPKESRFDGKMQWYQIKGQEKILL